MSWERILETIRSFDGVLELAPSAGSEYPEIAWGDHFFYYAPDGEVPQNRQPFATIVTKDYPGDDASRLDPGGRWRLNVHVGSRRSAELLQEPAAAERDFGETDAILPHPVYGSLGWIAVVDPGPRTLETVLSLLENAWADDRARVERRG
ncbi:DUF6194 family protein [Naasia aerilata]|uniref:DUF6194 domain-containing protein n=1 Tax=Naasia aerilata TaxID=1162966 RepID=A0ABM8G8T1_9MICO|nr:DUF6194 family protein [Naasia aerilata]BDZ44585.1 hypothetical protein GCM10025866_04940 [Naasia aerilata]